MEGYVKLYRQLLDSTQFADPIRLKVWIWCLIKANHKTRAVPLKTGKGYTTVMVKRGQFIFGRNKASDELNVAGSTVLRHLEKLEAEKAIKIHSDKQYSLITICKYEDYQSIEEESEQPMNNLRTTNELASDTNNNDNNVYNEKNSNIDLFTETSSVIIPEGDGIKKEMPLYSKMVDIWITDTHPEFVFTKTDGSKIKSIIKKITILLTHHKRETGDKDISDFFSLMCSNLPEWFKDKDLKTIDSDFNQIILKIKEENKNGSTIKAKQRSAFAN